MATKYIESRIAELEAALKEPEDLLEIYQAIGLIRHALEDIRQNIRQHPFTNLAEEIHYFKVLAPPVYGRLMYFVTVTETGMLARHSNQDRMEALLKLELAKTEQFFTKHGEFCQYYHLNQTHMDDRIFIRDARENGRLDYIEVIMADDFCVGCYWAALLWANERLMLYFADQLRKLRQPGGLGVGGESLVVLEWTDSQTDFVELIYGLYVKGSFNQGKATLKEIVAWMEQHLKIDAGNFYNTVKEIARRKKGPVKFIDDLRDRTLRKLEEMI